MKRLCNNALFIKTLLGLLCVLPYRSAHCQSKNHYHGSSPYVNLQKGMYWPKGQALPQFATPSDTLDGIDLAKSHLTSSEQLLFVALQGLVNRTKPCIFLYDVSAEGKNKWPDNLHLNINKCDSSKIWSVVKKYKGEINGLVLYSTQKNAAYLNLATTVGAINAALPVTRADYRNLIKNGIHLPVLADLTSLPYTTPAGIYQYLYDHYWKYCNKRLLVSLNNKISARVRDIGFAAKSAFVWLDPRKPDQKKVLKEFFGDMKAGQGLVIGWWPEERSGVGLGTSFGIATVASDFYENASVYAGMSHHIELPEVPKMPALKNKIYLAIFLSDGDNVQYCEHAMAKLWDDKDRGIIPINWTVSPALLDFGPGLLNYYYATASPNDFFASGPSGLGYALIYDALNKKWNLTDSSIMDAYTKSTEQYLEKSGLRVITIWDEVNDSQMNAYATNCRYLYGATLEDWGRSAPLKIHTKQGRLAFIPNRPGYAGNTDDIYKHWAKQVATFDSSHPMFLAAQGVSWKMGPADIVKLKEKLEKLSPGNIVICRGDHFFSLYNEAHKLDFNLCLLPQMKVNSSPAATPVSYAADGSPSKEYQWRSSGNGKKWIELDFKKAYLIDRYVVRHAGAAGMNKKLNNRSFTLELSSDGHHWQTADQQNDNEANVSDIDIQPVKARYVRLDILNAGKDSIARIGDIEVYGKGIRR